MPRVQALAIAIALLSLALAHEGLAASGDAPCVGFRYVPHQGPSCPLPGGWEVLLADGTRLLTHGPDTLTLGAPNPPGVAPAPPVCVEDPREPHGLLVYARPHDRPDRSAELATSLRALVNTSTGILMADADAAGASVSLRMRCDATGLVAIAVAEPLGTDSGNDSFASIANDLQQQGFRSPAAKYWVWYDDEVGGFAGQASIVADDRLAPDNGNLRGGTFAMTYGVLDAIVLLHESAHNLGAVQRSAPHQSGGWHCNDGRDVMCYPDAGDNSSYTEARCTDRPRFDCGADTYFHPSPASESYLAAHWNLGHPFNTYLHFGPTPPAPCDFAREGSLWAGAAGVPLEETSARTEAGVPRPCWGQPYALTGTPLGDFDVCWIGGARVLRCDATHGGEHGLVPEDADAARVVLRTGALASYRLEAS